MRSFFHLYVGVVFFLGLLLGVVAESNSFTFARTFGGDDENVSLERVKERFHAELFEGAHHESLNPCILPFTQRNVGSNSNHVSYAFSFLLSSDLDWHPAAQVLEHAYFQYKKRPYLMRMAGGFKTPRLVSQAAFRWGSTHVIGGELIQSNSSYCVSWKVYSPRGKELVSGEVGPASYFEVLGETSAALLDALGWSPTVGLRDYLKEPRCNSFGLVEQLDGAAFLEPRSDKEFDVYRSILEKDPAFAEVRYWYANQFSWKTGDEEFFKKNNVEGLDSRLMMAGFRLAVEYSKKRMKSGAGYAEWVKLFNELFPEGHPKLTAGVLMRTAEGHIWPLSLPALEQGVKMVADYPRLYDLGRPLTDLLEKRKFKIMDLTLSGALSVFRLEHLRLGNRGKKRFCYSTLGRASMWLGKSGWAKDFLNKAFYFSRTEAEKYSYWYLDVMAMNALLSGDFSSVVDILESLEGRVEPFSDTQRSCYQIAALLSGRMDFYERLKKSEMKKNSAVGEGSIVRDYFADLHTGALAVSPWGHSLNPEELEKGGGSISFSGDLLAEGVLASLQEVLHTKQAVEGEGSKPFNRLLLIGYPSFRLLWSALDARDRADPGLIPDVACFYEVLKWLYPEDIWVQEACADFYVRKSTLSVYSEVDRMMMERKLKYAYKTNRSRFKEGGTVTPSDRWPFLYSINYSYSFLWPLGFFSRAWLIKAFLDEGLYDEAEYTCFRGMNQSSLSGLEGSKVMYNDLFHLIDRARKNDLASDIPWL